MRMLDLGLQQSRLRRETTHMIKATGRLIFPSLSRLLDHIPDGFDFVADARAWLTPWKKNRVPFVGTQLILFSHHFYAAHLQTQYDEMAGSYRPVHSDHSWKRSCIASLLNCRKRGTSPLAPLHPQRRSCGTARSPQPLLFASATTRHQRISRHHASHRSGLVALISRLAVSRIEHSKTGICQNLPSDTASRFQSHRAAHGGYIWPRYKTPSFTMSLMLLHECRRIIAEDLRP
jgi:hypothetical protein